MIINKGIDCKITQRLDLVYFTLTPGLVIRKTADRSHTTKHNKALLHSQEKLWPDTLVGRADGMQRLGDRRTRCLAGAAALRRQVDLHGNATT